MMNQPTQAIQKKRKMLLVLPVLAVSFTTFLFWSQGGGKGLQTATVNNRSKGLNVSLPDASVQSRLEDKLTLYQQALKDSQKLDQQRKEDPYNHLDTAYKSAIILGSERQNNFKTLPQPVPHAGSVYTDPNEEKVNRKLAELQRALQQPSYPGNKIMPESDDENDAAIDRLQKTVQTLQQSGSGENPATDPDLEKMNGMLDKIYNIQHPDAVNQQLAMESEKHKGLVYSPDKPVSYPEADLLTAAHLPADSTDNVMQVKQARFYESDNSSGNRNGQDKAVPAFINETQTLVSGSTVKLQLDAEIFLNGTDIPKGTLVFGTCSLNGERMNIDIKSIRCGNELFPVNLAVYDLDGIPGIRIPGAITRDAVKEGANQGVQSLDLMTMSDNLASQAASAGIQATKTLLGRKAKLIRATVRAGYPVLLKDNNKKDN